ncbi:MAG TPA: site-2 protease family protein [Verrucomicrobiae bacterium]
MTCTQCSAEIAQGLLVCPSCHTLVHRDELKTIAAEAEAASAAGALAESLNAWRRALQLLPPHSAQHAAIRQKTDQLVRQIDSAPHSAKAAPKPKWASAAGTLGVIGLLLWKFKFILVFALTKAKLLLLGLTKASTFFSMLLSLGLYWSIWGWKFALGIVLSIYVHEMGHIWMLRRYGIPATAPMFIPGLGAFIRMKQYPASPHEDARVGLAGPVWGLGAAVASWLIFLGTGAPIFAAIARFGAWVNLFNLLPIFQLDGGHAFRALTKKERALIAALMFVMWITTHEGLLLILAAVAAFRAFQKDAPTQRDTKILLHFAFLIITLSLLSKLPVPLEPKPEKQPLIAKLASP